MYLKAYSLHSSLELLIYSIFSAQNNKSTSKKNEQNTSFQGHYSGNIKDGSSVFFLAKFILAF
jgi:hypothetical protein